MSIESRLSAIEQRIDTPAPDCACHGDREVTIDMAGRIICDLCRGAIPSGTPIHLPAGLVPGPPDEPVCVGRVP
jgi:hypothetical protein